MIAMEIQMNKYQTPITKELLNGLPQEVQDQLLDIINNVEFVKRLISPSRKYAKDLPRDKEGRIIVDLANPHILEDMNYFRPSALFYKENECYTKLKPNSNPNSEYGRWIREERNRCWHGYVRESDGEWVTGPLYFYLNYCPIKQSKAIKGTKQANRIVDFPEVWEGIYWRFHYMYQARNGGLYNDFTGGNQGAELASRGKSKSYSMASILAHNFILGENDEACRDVVSMAIAFQKEFLIKDGVLNKFVSMADFCAEHTEFPRRRLKSSLQDMTWKMGYKDADLNIEKGTLNSVLGISIKEDESKARGKRASFIGVEEFGTMPNLVDLYNIMIPSVREGNYIFGLLYLQGTAGDSASDFAGAQEIMYNPKGYGMYALPNVFDKTNSGKSNFVFFFPGYINRKGLYNENGVSDVIMSLVEILMERYTVKHNSTDPNTILKTIAEVPITPSEAIIKTSVNMFPVADLTERLSQLDTNASEYNDVYIGELIPNKSGKVEFTPTSAQPIRDFPHKDNKMEGAIEIYKMPERDRFGNVFPDRYILSCDPYDDDSSDTMSLCSIYVLDLWTDNIVAEYTGRPKFAEDSYEIARRLCLFYNGKLNYENNKKGLFAYFSKMNSLYLLSDVLDFLKDKDMVKVASLYGNKSKGTIATGPINNYARSLLRSWLISPVTIMQKIDGKDEEITIPRLFLLRSRALIKELILYNQYGNFDRISSMGMLMLLREDKMILYNGDVSRAKEDIESSYLGNDPFFERNYLSRCINK